MDTEKMLRFLQNEHALPKLHNDLNARQLQALGLDYDGNELCIMRRISRNEGITQVELASEVISPTPTVTRKVKKLIARGLIDRQNDSRDERKNRLFLTAEGKAAARVIYNLSEEALNMLFEGFTDEERETCAAYMERMRLNAENALNK